MSLVHTTWDSVSGICLMSDTSAFLILVISVRWLSSSNRVTALLSHPSADVGSQKPTAHQHRKDSGFKLRSFFRSIYAAIVALDTGCRQVDKSFYFVSEHTQLAFV